MFCWQQVPFGYAPEEFDFFNFTYSRSSSASGTGYNVLQVVTLALFRGTLQLITSSLPVNFQARALLDQMSLSRSTIAAPRSLAVAPWKFYRLLLASKIYRGMHFFFFFLINHPNILDALHQVLLTARSGTVVSYGVVLSDFIHCMNSSLPLCSSFSP